jgi:hypothetical protein
MVLPALSAQSTRGSHGDTPRGRDNFWRDLQGSGGHGFCRHSITSVSLCVISLSEALSWTISRSCSQMLCLSSILAWAVNTWTACTTRDRRAASSSAPSVSVSTARHTVPMSLWWNLSHSIVRKPWRLMSCIIVKPLEGRKTSPRTIPGFCLRGGDY